ncbi:MAG: IgGFc-binding protein [Aquabacterium sp.]|nr:IgGFc-binding protein [Aquabacterium sp.]
MALLASLFALAPALAAVDSKGTSFWLMFPANFSGAALTLFITGDTATTGTVSIPGSGFSTPFSVTPGVVTSVPVPNSAEVTAVDSITNQGIRVVANAEVTVYGLSRLQATTDAFLGLPTDALGTDYINLGFRNVNIVNATQFGIVATQNGTVVTITPTAQAGSRTAGVPFSVTLNQGQTYLLRSTASSPADLSGSLISATAPIAVFGGHQCANIPSGNVVACDYIVEQLPHTGTWGRSFATMPLATRILGDTFRILASVNGTVVSVNGVNVATLNRGQFHEQTIAGPASINATQPVLVAQYSNSSSFDGVTSDPFMMLIPPFEQFLASYTVTTPASGFNTNFINIVVPNASVGVVTLDGTPVPGASYTAIAGTGFSGARLPVTLGAHNLSGPLPFGAFMYGFASFDSYGYPGGQSFDEVAKVTRLTLSPATSTGTINTQHCVNAAVSDQFSQPVPGVRVDFTVTGVNPRTGFVNANLSGVAQYCYTGTNLGTDTVGGIVSTIAGNNVTRTWTATVVATCDIDRDGDIDISDVNVVRAAIGQTPAANDPRDANLDRKITINDVRACTLRCTRANCAAN